MALAGGSLIKMTWAGLSDLQPCTRLGCMQPPDADQTAADDFIREAAWP
jgi:hypothetical protein